MLSSNLKSHDKTLDKSLRIIIPLVVGVHLLIAILLNGLNQEPVVIMPKKGVVVHSVKLSPKVLPKAMKEVAEVQKEVKQEILPIVEVGESPAPIIKSEQKPIPKPEISPKVEVVVPPAPVIKPEQKAVPKPTPKPIVEKKPAKVIPKPIEQKKPVVEKKKTAPPPSPPAPKIVKVKPDNKEWIALAKEKIGKIALSSDRISSNSHQNLKEIATPSPIENFITDLSFIDSGTTFSDKESAYRDELAKRLKLYLKLPEYGEVKVKLTIDRAGKVIFTKVLSFQSAKNASFIEQNLPKLKMPPFGDNFKGVSEFDFTIVLSNE